MAAWRGNVGVLVVGPLGQELIDEAPDQTLWTSKSVALGGGNVEPGKEEQDDLGWMGKWDRGRVSVTARGRKERFGEARAKHRHGGDLADVLVFAVAVDQQEIRAKVCQPRGEPLSCEEILGSGQSFVAELVVFALNQLKVLGLGGSFFFGAQAHGDRY